MKLRAASIGAGMALVLIGVGLGLTSCQTDEAPAAAAQSVHGGLSDQPWFRERSKQAGLAFTHETGAKGDYWFPEMLTGGSCLCDFDSDEDLDLYLVQGGAIEPDGAELPGNQLFENLGDGSFRDVTAESGTGDTGYGMGCACGDVDRDGDLDLFVTNEGRDVLYENDGTGRFSDVTVRAGLTDPGWSTSAAFLDYDADGDLDLFVTRYVLWRKSNEKNCAGLARDREYCSPVAYNAPARDGLYENLGNGAFRNVTAAAGLNRAYGNGLGVVCADLDGDGRLDIYVANDGVANQLWINEGSGRFDERSLLSGTAVNRAGLPEAGMGVVAFDLEEDGDLDILLTHLVAESNTCYVNEGGFFEDRTIASGLEALSLDYTGFGIGVADFDHDGFADVYVANGRVTSGEATNPSLNTYDQVNQLVRGVGAGAFEEVFPVGGTAEPIVLTSRAAAFGDVDNDGDIDVVVVNRDAPVTYLENVVARPGTWVQFRVLDERGHEATGAMVRLSAGGRMQWRLVNRAYSFQASNDPRVHFGLGSAESIDEVLVRWLDGLEESFGPVAPARLHVLRRGEGTSLEEALDSGESP